LSERRNFNSRRGFRRAGPRFVPKPVEIGKEYEVDIKETSRRGEGIARIEGLVTFIPNAKPGDHVRIRITRVGRRAAEAEVVGKAEAAEEGKEEQEEDESEEE
jgi:predicted RNA-binding protein with TRAM domain